ncbi:WD40 repeat domain-containing protein [Okeania sp.]|uniref:WD40 repeat domain-containing protein n=1 Tax=Okeania sp. TaxID=3100323 RepID=UPI002B4B2C94|nr:WD40 repeat domain-containing protein [Okeania sp.]MEB3340005.1 WD40 repeat domain-containing protein [Okeania sp.]
MQSKQITQTSTTIAMTALITAFTTTVVIKSTERINWQQLLSTKIPETNHKLTEKKQPLKTLSGHSTWVYAVAMSSDGKTLASSSYDGTVKIWDLPSGKLTHTIAAHADAVQSMAITPDGKIMVTGGWDDCVKLWNFSNGNLVSTINVNADDIKAVTISPDGETIGIGSYSGIIKLLSLKTGTEILRLHHSSPVISLAFSPDGKTLASGGKNGKLKIWDVKTGTEQYILKAHSRPIWAIAYNPKAKTLASGSQDGTIKLWKTDTGQEIGTFDGHSKAVLSVAFSPDGETLASGSYDKKIYLWQVENQKLIETYQSHTKPVWSVGFSPDGETLASGSADETIKLWSVSARKSSPQLNVTNDECDSNECQAKPKMIFPEIYEAGKLEELNQKLYDQINQSWQTTPIWYEDLEYLVKVDGDGAIASYEPMNQSAQNYVLETPLPRLVNFTKNKSVSEKQKQLGLFRVILSPTGVLEVSPWWGWDDIVP